MRKIKINYLVVTVFVISIVFIASCSSVLPPSGTVIDCNGQKVIPLKNPTIRTTFPGGDNAMMDFMEKNFESAVSNIKGNATIAFIVTKEGEICNIRVTSKSDDYLATEIVRVLKMMPKWEPAINEGEIVDSYKLITFTF